MMPNHDFSNSIEHSSPFQYPQDEEDLEEQVQLRVNDKLIKMYGDLMLYSFTSGKNPLLTLVAFSWAAGVDVCYIGKTLSEIARRFGISKQSLSVQVKRIRRDFGLTHSHTNQTGKSADKYKNNARKAKAI